MQRIGSGTSYSVGVLLEACLVIRHLLPSGVGELAGVVCNFAIQSLRSPRFDTGQAWWLKQWL